MWLKLFYDMIEMKTNWDEGASHGSSELKMRKVVFFKTAAFSDECVLCGISYTILNMYIKYMINLFYGKELEYSLKYYMIVTLYFGGYLNFIYL